jgi:hypothetical protein
VSILKAKFLSCSDFVTCTVTICYCMRPLLLRAPRGARFVRLSWLYVVVVSNWKRTWSLCWWNCCLMKYDCVSIHLLPFSYRCFIFKRNFWGEVYLFVAPLIFAEPFPSNDSGIHTDTQTDEMDLWITPLRWTRSNVHTNFHKDYFQAFKSFYIEDSQTHRQHGDLICLLLFIYFLEIREVG